MLNIHHNNMKTKIERQGSNEIPRFAVGALAIAGASAASGASVQITFANNYVSSSAGTTNLVTDLTGDGLVDVAGRGVNFYAGLTLGGIILARAYASIPQVNQTEYAFHAVSLPGVKTSNGYFWNDTRSVSGLTPLTAFTFTDQRVNSGALTYGILDLTVSAVNPASFGQQSNSVYKVQIHRLIFDDQSTTAPAGLPADLDTIAVWTPSAIPEPSSLALLALGAGGLLARRRRAQAAA